MHPMLTHTPPSLSRSTTAVVRPSWAARMAQTYPAGPPPRMMMSKELEATSRILGVGVLVDHPERILQHPRQSLEKARPGRPVDDAVIAGHGDPHPAADLNRAVVRHRLGLDPTDGTV